MAQESWMLQKAWKRREGTTVVTGPCKEVRWKAKSVEFFHTICSCCMPIILEVVTLEKLFKDTNLDTLSMLLYQDCIVAKIWPW